MTKSKLFAAAAVLASALAAPAMAQEVVYNPGYCAQFYPNANCQNRGTGNPYTGSYQHQAWGGGSGRDWRGSYNRWDGNDGFGPGEVAAGVVGGAVGTAAAIATAPFGGGYARRNGFICEPGTVFRGDDGRQHLCQ